MLILDCTGGANLTVDYTATSYSFRTYCQPPSPWHSCRTMLRLTECTVQWSISPNTKQLSSHRGYGQLTVQTLTQSTVKSGACCRDEPTMPGSTPSTSLSIVSKNGITYIIETSSELFNGGMFDGMCARLWNRWSLWADVVVLWKTYPYWKLQFYGANLML